MIAEPAVTRGKGWVRVRIVPGRSLREMSKDPQAHSSCLCGAVLVGAKVDLRRKYKKCLRAGGRLSR